MKLPGTGASPRHLVRAGGVAVGLVLCIAWLATAIHPDAAIAPSRAHPLFRFTDTGTSGRTSIESLPADTAVRSVVHLGSGVPRPFAGMGFSLISSESPSGIDLSWSDSLVIEYRHVGTSRIDLFANVRLRPDSAPLHLEASLPADSTPVALDGLCPDGAYVLPVSTPWSRFAVSRDAFRAVDGRHGSGASAPAGQSRSLDRTLSVGIQVRGAPNGIPDTLEVRSIRAVAARGRMLAPILQVALLLLLMATAVFLTRRFFTVPDTAPGPDPVPLSDRSSMEESALLAWLSANYHRDMDLETAGKAVGIHPRRLAPILKACTGRSFPAHVNHLRIAEAKRLLVETDRQVSEIASAVGFSDAKYFQRVFKSATGSTPGDWRDRHPPPGGSIPA